MNVAVETVGYTVALVSPCYTISNIHVVCVYNNVLWILLYCGLLQDAVEWKS